MVKWNFFARILFLLFSFLVSCLAFPSVSDAGRVVTECRTVYTVIRSPWGTGYLVPQLSCWDTWEDDGRGDPGGDVPDIGGGGGGGGPDLEPAPAEDNSDTGPCEKTSQPVAIATGRKLLDEVDVSLSGELPLSLRRSYRSGSSAVGAFGRKWLSNLDYKLEFRYAGAGYAQKICAYEPGLTDPDCAQAQTAQALSAIVAYRDGAAVYTFDLFDAASNKWNDSKSKSVTFMQPDVVGNPSKWTLYHEDGTIEVYNKIGRIESIQNKMGVGLTFAYGAQNKLQTVRHSSGRTLTLAWLGNRVSSVTDPAGKKTLYSYNANGYLEKVTLPDASTRTYHYEDVGAGNLTGVSVNGVRYSRVAYYANGQVKESGLEGGVDKSSFSYTGNATTVTGALGGATTYTYSTDSKGIKRLTGVSRNGSSVCPAAAASTGYDVNGNIDYELDWKGQRTEYSYSDKGRLLTQYGFGRTKVNTWDDVNNRIVKTEYYTGQPASCAANQTCTPGGTPYLTQSFVYYADTDAAKHRIKTVTLTAPGYSPRSTSYSYTFHANKMLKTVVVDGPYPGAGDRLTRNYDSAGNLVSELNGLGHSISYTGYDAHGLVGKITDANGVATDYTYDEKGRVRTVSRSVDAGTLTLTYTYNGHDKVTRIDSSSGASISLAYDSVGRLLNKSAVTDVTQLDPDTTRKTEDLLSFTYNNFNEVLTQKTGLRITHSGWDPVRGKPFTTVSTSDSVIRTASYDTLGLLSAHIGNNGQRIDYRYDAAMQPESATDALSRKTSMTYTADGKLQIATDANGGVTRYDYDGMGYLWKVTDPNNNVTTYTRNGFGEVVSQSSPDTGTTTFTYSDDGTLKSLTRSNGASVYYTRDAFGRLLTVVGGNESIGYGYDSCSYGTGRLCSVTDSSGSTDYTYARDGQLKTQSTTIKGTRYETSWSYDGHGRLAGMVYPNGVQLRYSYNSTDRINKIEAYAGGSWKVVVTAVNYQPFGGINSFAYGNNQVRVVSIDRDGRPTSITGTGVQNLGYSYDAADQLKRWTNGYNSNSTHDLDYNRLSQLTVSNNPLAARTFNYDRNGNRSSVIDTRAGQTYTYSTQAGSNRLLGISGGALNRSMAYDSVGNLKQDVRSNNETWCFKYDGLNRMASARRYESAINCDTVSISLTGADSFHSYNGLNQRVQKHNSTANQKYNYLYLADGTLVGETAANQTVLDRVYVWFGGEIVGLIRNNQVHAVHNDHLGRPEVVTDSNRNVVWRTDLFAFTRPAQGSVDSIGGFNVGFPGQYYDIESNLWQNWHRYYDATLGRYTQSDPIGLSGGLNTYSYVANNPTHGVDPTGTEIILFGICTGLNAASGVSDFVGVSDLSPSLEMANEVMKGVAEDIESCPANDHERRMKLEGLRRKMVAVQSNLLIEHARQQTDTLRSIGSMMIWEGACALTLLIPLP